MDGVDVEDALVSGREDEVVDVEVVFDSFCGSVVVGVVSWVEEVVEFSSGGIVDVDAVGSSVIVVEVCCVVVVDELASGAWVEVEVVVFSVGFVSWVEEVVVSSRGSRVDGVDVVEVFVSVCSWVVVVCGDVVCVGCWVEEVDEVVSVWVVEVVGGWVVEDVVCDVDVVSYVVEVVSWVVCGGIVDVGGIIEEVVVVSWVVEGVSWVVVCGGVEVVVCGGFVVVSARDVGVVESACVVGVSVVWVLELVGGIDVAAGFSVVVVSYAGGSVVTSFGVACVGSWGTSERRSVAFSAYAAEVESRRRTANSNKDELLPRARILNNQLILLLGSFCDSKK